MTVNFDTGEVIVVLEEWRGYLWSASPRVVVEDREDLLIEWVPAGTVVHSATSRGVSGRDSLARTDRQLASLETRRWNYRAGATRASKLSFVTEKAWSRVELTWLSDGSFLHWYVNFQRPVRRFELGYETMDLIVDIIVEPDLSWRWKDRECFDSAVERGVFEAATAEGVMEECDRVLGMLAGGTGPFDPRWRSWETPSDWDIPKLRTAFPHGRTPAVGASVDDSVYA